MVMYYVIIIVLCVLVLLAIAVLFMKLSLLQMTVQGGLTARIGEEDIRKMEDAIRQSVNDGMKMSMDAQAARQDAADKLLETQLQGIQRSLSEGLLTMSDKQFDRLAVIERAVTDAVNSVARSEAESFSAMSKLISEKLDAMSARTSESIASLERSTGESVRGMAERQAAAQEQSDAMVKERLDTMSERLAESQSKSDTVVRERLDAMAERLTDSQSKTDAVLCERLDSMSERLAESQSRSDTVLRESLENMQKTTESSAASLKETVKTSLTMTDTVIKAEFGDINGVLKRALEKVDTSVSGMARTVNEQLNIIRKTVDDQLSEHLEKRLSDSFSQVSSQLESVYEGLGEMRVLAQGVGDLNKVLSNTRSRGIVGETQLRTIITDMLTPDQYAEDIITVEGSGQRVEFAVKLPVDNGFVWLPIDAKFPNDTYAALQDAYETGSASDINLARNVLRDTLHAQAEAIHEKYVHEPETTGFGVMFLPFEGLYAEAVNMGMVEDLNRNYRVNIAGPSTMSALLCSLQMSFKTIAIQKRSQEVWEVLSGVQTEFDVFSDALEKVETKINQAGSEVGKLRGTRIRAIEKKLRKVDNAMSIEDADRMFGIEASVPALAGPSDKDRGDFRTA